MPNYSGIWTRTQQMQAKAAGTWTEPAPTTIGQAYGGGYYGGKINVSGTQYYLVVADKTVGEIQGAWGTNSVFTGVTSVINGPANTTTLAALGSAYAAATFCENLNSGGYTGWYMPALNELEVLYYFLKIDNTANNTSSGSNANAVSPEPISTNYTSGSPSQTTATNFRLGASSQEFAAYTYWVSTDVDASTAWQQSFNTGHQANGNPKQYSNYTRAIRRVAV
jgi:hypothetical protein